MESDTRYIYNQQLQSALIDALDDYTGNPYSKWLVGHKFGKNEDPYEDRALFVVRPPHTWALDDQSPTPIPQTRRLSVSQRCQQIRLSWPNFPLLIRVDLHLHAQAYLLTTLVTPV